MNAYVTDLISKDIEDSRCLPVVTLPDTFDEKVRSLSGAMTLPSETDLEKDDRMSRIWKR